jgi:hypothetical protein
MNLAIRVAIFLTLLSAPALAHVRANILWNTAGNLVFGWSARTGAESMNVIDKIAQKGVKK